MSHTSFVKHIKDNTLSPFAMYEAFPRSDYYGDSVALQTCVCLGNPHLDI